MRFLTGRMRWVLIFWMFLISAISYLDRVNISIAGQFLQTELRLSNTQLGYVFSAFVSGYALFQAPAGRLADKLGPRAVIALATVWWGVFTALSGSVSAAFAGALTMLLAVRFLLGVYLAQSSFWSITADMAGSSAGSVSGFMNMGNQLGGTITASLTPLLANQFGWNASFLTAAGLCAMGALAGCLLIRITN